MTTANEVPDGAGTAGEGRIAGIVLLAATLLSILMMAHHPSATTHDPDSLAADIAGSATLSRVVHGVLIALIGAELYAFVVFSGRLAQGRSAARAGFVAYAIGAGAMIGAALISGFVVSSLGVYYAGASDPAPFVDFARLSMTGNQALAKLGVVCKLEASGCSGVIPEKADRTRGGRADERCARGGAECERRNRAPDVQRPDLASFDAVDDAPVEIARRKLSERLPFAFDNDRRDKFTESAISRDLKTIGFGRSLSTPFKRKGIGASLKTKIRQWAHERRRTNDWR